MYSTLRSLIFRLSPETSHNFSLAALSTLHKLKLLKLFYPKLAENKQPVKVMGLQFPNKLGLAAGLDKNADHLDALGALGFGFVEVGTVTPKPQEGNPKPRLFRLADHDAIINRMGFNNKGVEHLLQQVKQSRYSGIIGINIGKNLTTSVENALDDYLVAMRSVYESADYITINISSPNTPGLRSLQYGEELDKLLSRLVEERVTLQETTKKYTPIAVKVAPDLSSEEIASISEILQKNSIDAVIATNTTLSREAVADDAQAEEQGGLSGAPLTERSTEVIRAFYSHLQGSVPIIGVGGICSAADAQAKLDAGAELVQIYSCLIYQGPELINDILKKL
ncbi:MAG: Dihydroorotate dehydrogenase (EC [uncultured Thiotrichaceae bacterium]|uniref:Dihydroorotate dehydrogenase (quinone) n=1 Tax=uncultured Thiotrichaceae bacterium TaxID=298394 RepID=A0A6S6TLQ6_9GAMM|nr:MAG: Dihydroorotate dehydrogenase (EC [uncultured Thiotrichaceae bacterium]